MTDLKRRTLAKGVVGLMPSDGESSARGRSKSLRAHAEEIETVRRLSAALRGRELPDVELTTVNSLRVPLHAYVSGLAVVYFVPGENDGRAWVDGRATLDAAQHAGYVKHHDDFQALHVKVLSIISQPAEDLARMNSALGATYPMFSDPELLVGQAIDLPTVKNAEKPRYRRIALMALDGRIQTALQTDDSYAPASARQALTWLTATYGDGPGHGQTA